MKTHTTRFSNTLLALTGSVLLITPVTQGAWLYWDTNGNTANLGTTAGTWGSSTFIATVSAGGGRGILDGTIAPAVYATTTSDTLSFGTLNLALTGAATTVTVSGTQSIGNITFGLAQTEAMTLTGGTISFGSLVGGGTIYALAPNTTHTIESIIDGTGAIGLTKGGQGTLLLTGANTYIGTTVITSGGMLQLGNGAAAGTLNGATGTALTFNNGGGIFNLAKDNGGSQNMGVLTFSAGDGTIRSTAASGSATQTLTFGSLAARASGATGNFELATNTTAADNKIVLTGAATGFLDKGLFFGGSSYAAYDASSYVRGLVYGSDANTAATNTITASNHVQLTSSPAARTGDTLLSLNLSGGGVDYTMNAGSLTVPAILKSGGGAVSTISGGASVTTAANAELVIRTDTSSDLLTISSAVTGFSGGLTKTGAGTLTLSGSNGYTGTTTINAGTLALSGGSAIADTVSVVLADAAGATLRLDSSETIANLSGGGFSGGNVNVQGNTLTLNMTGNQTFGGTFTGTSGGAVTKTGSNTLTLNNANSFAGTINLDAGSLTFAIGNSGTTLLQTISSGGAINMAGGTTLNVIPANQVALGQQTSNNPSQLTVAGAGYVISNNISVTSGTGTLVLSGNGNRVVYSGEISGGTSGNQILKANSGVPGNGGSQQYVFSGVIKNGTGGSTLGVTIDATGTGAASNPHLFNFTGQNTFTGPIVAQNTINSTGGVYFVVGGERINNTTGITIGNGYLGGGNYSNTIALATNTILDYASTANQTFGGIISGGGSFIKEAGTGNVTLTAANSYTGATTLNGGTLDLGGGTANGSLDSTVLNMGGATLNYTRTGNTTQAFTTTNITAGVNTITAVAGNTLTLGALARSGSGSINFGTTGTITTSTANDATGIIGGWATFGGTNWAVANGAGSAITGFAGSYTLTSSVLNAGASYNAVNIGVDSSQTPDAVITPNTLTFNTLGANTLTLTGTTNTIPGIMVNSAVGDNASLITGGTLRGTNGGSLNIYQNNTTGASSALTIGSVIANNTSATGLNKYGAGTLILTAANTYTGVTTINAGTLQIGNGGATGALATGSTIVNNGNLTINRNNAIVQGTNFSNNISGTGSVTMDGGTLTLSNTGTNTFSGGFTLNSGQVSLPTNTTYTGFGTGLLTLNGGSLRGGNTTTATIINNDVAWNATVGFGRSGGGNPVFTFNGAITLNGSVGTSALGAAEAYSMTFNGNIGESTAGSSLTFGTNSSGHVFTFNGQNTFTGGINTSSKALVIGGSGYLGGGNYAGAISSGTFTYSSSAYQILSGVNSITGATTVNAGTLVTTNAAALSGYNVASRIVFNGGTVGVRVGGAGWSTTQVNTLLSNATKTSGSLGIDTTNGDLTQWTAFTTTNMGSALGLTKLGTNTLTLDQVNTYTGATLVSAGTLFISGSLVSDVTVSDGATLAGGGTVDDLILGGGSLFDIFLAVDSSDSLAATNISFAAGGFGIDNLRANGSAVDWGTVSDGIYTLITGTLNSTNLDNFGSGNAYDLGGGRSAYFQNGSLQLVVETIPEPKTALLGVLGVLLLLRRRRQ